MPRAATTTRAQPWLEGLGDWPWPGRGLPELPQLPGWVPAFPKRQEPALDGAAELQRRRLPRTLVALLAGTLSVLVALAAALALRGSPDLQELLGAGSAPVATAAGEAAARPLPPLVAVSSDAAGSSIDHATFASAALGGQGSFYVYLTPGFASGTQRYPVLYLLHGRNGHADAFLEIGIQSQLDSLIARHAIAPLIAVMPQDRSGLDNWRDTPTHRSASYVIEVQEMVDRMLPTIATRAGRAIAGSSMGGFGAMHVALANPYRFAVVESWLGFFNNLEGELLADRPIIARRGLSAFLYGAAEDPVAWPQENPLFAARLRVAGAQAQSAIFPGGHSLEKIAEHLEAGIVFADRSLRAAMRRAAGEEAELSAARRLARRAAGGSS